MISLWSKFQGWIVGAVIGIVSLAAIYLKGRSAGKAAEQQKQVEAKVETIEKVQDVQTEVARLPDSSVDERLSKWTRD